MNEPVIGRLLRLSLGSLAALGVLALASCSSDPGIRFAGQLLNADGTPAAGLTVFFNVYLADDPDSQHVDTDGDGRFGFVTHAQGNGLDGATFAGLSVLNDAASVSISAETHGEDVTIPPIRLWGAQATIAAGASGAIEVSWPEAPEGTSPHYQVRLYQGMPSSGYAPLWTSAPGDDRAFTVPPEVVEDRFASAEIVAGDIDCSYPADATGICITQRTARVPLPIGADVPLSRGATCTAGLDGVESPLLTLGAPPCPLTDGLASTAMPTCTTDPCPGDVVVDLGAVTEIHAVAVHGAGLVSTLGIGGELVLETTSDGVAFTEIGNVSTASFYSTDWLLTLPQPVSASAVRLRSNPWSLMTLTELAVF